MFIRSMFFVFLLGSSSIAEESYDDLRLGDLIDRCLVALEGNGNAVPFAEELRTRRNFNLGPTNQQRGLQCLETVYSERFSYEDRRFVSKTQVLALQKMVEDQKAREDALALRRSLRRQAVLQALVEVCFEEYSRDRFRALTSQQCQEVFFETGLPEE
ncbi:MAG: hypothetical protein ACU0AU_04790 [Cognatishimia activa]